MALKRLLLLLAAILQCGYLFAADVDELELIYELKAKFLSQKAALENEPAVHAYWQHAEFLRAQAVNKTSRNASEKEAAAAKMQALKEYESFDLSTFYKLPVLNEAEKISNLYEVLEGLALIRQLQNSIQESTELAANAAALQDKSEKLYLLARKLEQFGAFSSQLAKDYKNMQEAFKQGSLGINNAASAYASAASAQISALNEQIRAQYSRAAVYVGIIAVILFARILLARIIRAAVENKDKLYSITKILNIFTTFIIILFSIFYFVENISYLISVLGFASAGLAIAMKDMFMSLLGWCVLQFGGGFHVGDRVRVSKDGSVFVGDIVDISLLKMTIYEDVTLTTYTQNRRAGRLVYIPNNYIFTDLLANYNYSALKSVWDGIDITFSFDSDIDYAREIMLNTATELSAPLATAAKSAISKMRNHYSMRSSGTEAKIFTFIEPYGVRLSVWFMAPSRETLKMRSIISAAILEKIRSAKSRIKIAYPTQTIYKKEIE